MQRYVVLAVVSILCGVWTTSALAQDRKIYPPASCTPADNLRYEFGPVTGTLTILPESDRGRISCAVLSRGHAEADEEGGELVIVAQVAASGDPVQCTAQQIRYEFGGAVEVVDEAIVETIGTGLEEVTLVLPHVSGGDTVQFYCDMNPEDSFHGYRVTSAFGTDEQLTSDGANGKVYSGHHCHPIDNRTKDLTAFRRDGAIVLYAEGYHGNWGKTRFICPIVRDREDNAFVYGAFLQMWDPEWIDPVDPINEEIYSSMICTLRAADPVAGKTWHEKVSERPTKDYDCNIATGVCFGYHLYELGKEELLGYTSSTLDETGYYFLECEGFYEPEHVPSTRAPALLQYRIIEDYNMVWEWPQSCY